MQQHSYIARGGQIVDASIVTAPTTRIKDEERQAINRGDTSEGWGAKRMAHTDQDARWTRKHGKSFYGYKLHANVDAPYKLVRKLKISAADVDDCQTLANVLDPSNMRSRVLADLGYDSGANRDLLAAHDLHDGIARRTQAGKELGDRLKARNRAISGTRARVEHVFACLHQLGGKTVRALTLARNTLAIALKCVVYNVKRLVWLATRTIRHEMRIAAAACRNNRFRSHEAACRTLPPE
ncbi:IS5 family transposase [Ralstonia chuxiongensis]|uniref:IS5 family transposase n=1 Tax=Ralstonia chuxiongensis TaxID=2957504 RepID=UPI0028F6622A|nr:IS5 family transposase [Ralstonia chuxiongensis]CAJ0781256.1 hypothetical protein R8510_04850 [Ralstonia chuxiongensis]